MRGLTLAAVAENLRTSISYISRIERGVIHDTKFANLYERGLSDLGANLSLGLLPQCSRDSANPVASRLSLVFQNEVDL